MKRSSKARLAVERTIPPPVGGWNARDALASMAETDAYVLDNWYPRPSYVEMRRGSLIYVRGLDGQVKTLAVYSMPGGQQQMLCFTDAGVFDVSFGGNYSSATPLQVRTFGEHQTEQFGDGTNNWLIAVNGLDPPFYWNGASSVLVTGITSPAITGLNTHEIINVSSFKGRLFFIRNDKLGFDYLPPGVAGGAATYFNLSSIATKGGHLMAMAVWTRDAGNGPDDYAVFITSQGEAIVYQGTDPNSATTWSLVGTFRIGKPLGRKCVLKYGADPIILTENGAFPLSSLLASGDERQKFAVSFKIEDAFSIAALESLESYGWKAVSFHEQDAMIVNVPRSNGFSEQFVMNTISKAWCKFTGWHARDFAVYKRNLYYTKGNSIYVAWTESRDETGTPGNRGLIDGKPIRYIAKQSYQSLGSPSLKLPIMLMPLLDKNMSDTTRYTTGIDVDFSSPAHVDGVVVSQDNYMIWDNGVWDRQKWAPDGSISSDWGGIASWPGRWLSPRLEIVSSSAKAVQAKWLGSLLRFMQGYGL